MYKHIFLDADDTLFDFKKAQLQSVAEIIKSYHIPFSEEVYSGYDCINHSLWQRFEMGELTKDEVQRERFSLFFNTQGIQVDGDLVNLQYQKSLEKQTHLVPYAEVVCKELSKKCILTIITNGVGKTQMQRIKASPLSVYIDNIVISEEIGVAKPSREFFEYALNVVGNPSKKDVLIVGDSLFSDIQGANNIGIDACWYNPNQTQVVNTINIKYVISDLREIIAIVNS